MIDRINSLRQLIKEQQWHAILFSDPDSVFFFTGFKSSHACFLVTPDQAYFFTDARYLGGAVNFFRDQPIEVNKLTKDDTWYSVLEGRPSSNVGILFEKTNVADYSKWRKAGVIFSDASEHVAPIRAAKSAHEIAAAEKAAHIADKALSAVIVRLRPGISEKVFAWELEKAGRELGAEKVSFDAIVAFGDHSAVPHHSPTDRKLRNNEPVLIDWGFVAEGLCSDCTRCFFVGTPTERWLGAYEQVLRAQRAGIDLIAPDKPIAAVQSEAEKHLPEKIPHSFGHGVGVEVHEYPRIHSTATGNFQKDMLVTAEPGLYHLGKFGIRIEDMLVITGTGCRSLTNFSKNIETALL